MLKSEDLGLLVVSKACIEGAGQLPFWFTAWVVRDSDWLGSGPV